MADNTRRNILAVLSPLVAAALTLAGYAFLGGQSAGALQGQVTALEQRVERTEREGELVREQLRGIWQRQGETNERLARIEGKLDRSR